MECKPENVPQLLQNMERVLHDNGYPRPMIAQLVTQHGRDPFIVLIACLLSLRARDSVTQGVAEKLFERASTPSALCALSTNECEEIVRPIGFFQRKTHTIKRVACLLCNAYNGAVPSTYEELIALPGVGPKTANLVLAEAFEEPALCVDTHVHRLSNHFGLVATQTPEETQKALEEIVPRHLWRSINEIFVMWGQHVCTPGKKSCPCSQLLSV